MRWALFSDAHGKIDHLRRVIDDARKSKCDRLISMGDVIDVKIPRSAAVSGDVAPEDVADAMTELTECVSGCLLLRGNQEERAMALLRPEQLPRETFAMLSAEGDIHVPQARITHGHTFQWLNPQPELWMPKIEAAMDRVVFHGHRHHQNIVVYDDLKTQAKAYSLLELAEARVLRLLPDKRYAVNVGPVFKGCWMIWDDEEMTVTPKRLS